MQWLRKKLDEQFKDSGRLEKVIPENLRGLQYGF